MCSLSSPRFVSSFRGPLYRLADVFKRIGLVERTGRGVDIIFEGVLRYGRPAPGYGRSTATSVVVRLPGGQADLRFLELVLDQEYRTQRRLPIDALLALRALRDNRRLDTAELARLIQKDASSARQVLEQLVDAGLAEPQGKTRGRWYLLSAAVYRKLGEPAAYVRRRGFDPLQQQQMVLQYVDSHGRITRREAAELCRIGSYQASRLLKSLEKSGELVRKGVRRGSYYERRRSQL